jgi:2'-5' RNA ligase
LIATALSPECVETEVGHEDVENTRPDDVLKSEITGIECRCESPKEAASARTTIMARLRTFLAVPLNKAVRDRIVSLQERLAGLGVDVKWVEPDNLHVTLLFLGEVDERDVMPICRAAADVGRKNAAISMTVETVGCFPNVHRPRVVWVGVGDGAAEVTALHDALEQPLLELGCYRREERHFTPHITLGRVKAERTGAGVAGALSKFADWRAGEVRATEFHVLSSELTPKGPVYSVLSRVPLSGK